MKKRIVLMVTGVFVIVAMLAVACGQSPEGNQQSGGKQVEATKQQGGASDDLRVRRITDVDEATLFIEAAGGFQDIYRDIGTKITYPWGSGVIISPDGLAVTNNHVVTGAAYLNVYVGDEQEPRRAEILGVSECSDLAVIDIDGNGYNYLEWRAGPIEAGLPIYAAGYPSDPEDTNPDFPVPYRIIDGTIITEEASGQTARSSIESVIEHSAILRGGNSGGPLVDESARVVGINYGGVSDSFGQPTERYLAIDRTEAQRVTRQLENGVNVDSIGVNGYALSGEGDISEAIAVDSVQTGSPAEKVGLKGITILEDHGHYIQDFIVRLEGTDLAVNGTMEEYCNVLRAKDPSDPLSIEVIRVTHDLESDELIGAITLQGVLNESPLKEEEEVPHTSGEEDHHSH